MWGGGAGAVVLVFGCGWVEWVLCEFLGLFLCGLGQWWSFHVVWVGSWAVGFFLRCFCWLWGGGGFSPVLLLVLGGWWVSSGASAGSGWVVGFLRCDRWIWVGGGCAALGRRRLSEWTVCSGVSARSRCVERVPRCCCWLSFYRSNSSFHLHVSSTLTHHCYRSTSSH